MSIESSCDPGCESLAIVVRLKLLGQEGAADAWLNIARSSARAASCSRVCWIEVERAPDVLLVAGTPDWAEHFVQQTRETGDSTPLVAINIGGENGSIARILDAGADDCISCPFDAAELLARLRAVLRRRGKHLIGDSTISADPSTLHIRVRDLETRVSRKQFEIFVYLAQRLGHWVHSTEIIAAVCGTHHDPTTSLLRVQIFALRKALGTERACIRCDGRRSYMLTITVNSAERSDRETALA